MNKKLWSLVDGTGAYRYDKAVCTVETKVEALRIIRKMMQNNNLNSTFVINRYEIMEFNGLDGFSGNLNNPSKNELNNIHLWNMGKVNEAWFVDEIKIRHSEMYIIEWCLDKELGRHMDWDMSTYYSIEDAYEAAIDWLWSVKFIYDDLDSEHYPRPEYADLYYMAIYRCNPDETTDDDDCPLKEIFDFTKEDLYRLLEDHRQRVIDYKTRDPKFYMEELDAERKICCKLLEQIKEIEQKSYE